MTNPLRLRPPLCIRTRLSPDEVVRRFQESIGGHKAGVTGTVSGYYVVLRVPEEHQHLGSPQLSFEIEADTEGAVLNGLFMPLPSVWTAFMALYGLIVFGGFCGAVYGYAQFQLGHSPIAWWSLPLTLLLSLVEF